MKLPQRRTRLENRSMISGRIRTSCPKWRLSSLRKWAVWMAQYRHELQMGANVCWGKNYRRMKRKKASTPGSRRQATRACGLGEVRRLRETQCAKCVEGHCAKVHGEQHCVEEHCVGKRCAMREMRFQLGKWLMGKKASRRAWRQRVLRIPTFGRELWTPRAAPVFDPLISK